MDEVPEVRTRGARRLGRDQARNEQKEAFQNTPCWASPPRTGTHTTSNLAPISEPLYMKVFTV